MTESKQKISGRFLAVLFAVVAVIALVGTPIALAAEGDDGEVAADATVGTVEGGGNSISAGSDFTASDTYESSLFWVGQDLEVSGALVGNDVVAAGASIALSDSTVDGDVYAVGQSLGIASTVVAHNVVMAGQTIDVASAAEARAFLLAGETITYAGTSSEVDAVGETVTIAGTVNGDVSISGENVVIAGHITGNVTVEAENLTIASAAVIEGELSGDVENEPTMEDGAQIASQSLAIGQLDDGGSTLDNLISGIVYDVFIYACAAVLLSVLLRGATQGAADMLRMRPLGLILSGAFGMVLALFCAVILLAILPLGVASLLVYAAAWTIAVPFAGAAIGRLATRAPQGQRVMLGALASVIMGLMLNVPYLDVLVMIVSFSITMGYLLQAMWFSMRGIPMPRVPGSGSGPELPAGQHFGGNGPTGPSNPFGDDSFGSPRE